jgi:hypothetical protein
VLPGPPIRGARSKAALPNAAASPVGAAANRSRAAALIRAPVFWVGCALIGVAMGVGGQLVAPDVTGRNDDASIQGAADSSGPASADAAKAKANGSAQGADQPTAPMPSAEQLAVLIAGLNDVAQGLGAPVDSALTHSRVSCAQMMGGVQGDALTSVVQQEFQAGDAPFVTADQAGRIVQTIRSSFCP